MLTEIREVCTGIKAKRGPDWQCRRQGCDTHWSIRYATGDKREQTVQEGQQVAPTGVHGTLLVFRETGVEFLDLNVSRVRLSRGRED